MKTCEKSIMKFDTIPLSLDLGTASGLAYRDGVGS